MSKAEDGEFNSPVKHTKATQESPISITPLSRRSPRINPDISVTSPRKRITRSSCSPSEKKEIVDAEKMNILAEKNIQVRKKLQLQRRSANKNEEGKTGNKSTEKPSISSVQSKEQGTLTEEHELHQGYNSNNDTISEQFENEKIIQNTASLEETVEEREKTPPSKPTTSTYRSGLGQMIQLFKELNGYKNL